MDSPQKSHWDHLCSASFPVPGVEVRLFGADVCPMCREARPGSSAGNQRKGSAANPGTGGGIQGMGQGVSVHPVPRSALPLPEAPERAEREPLTEPSLPRLDSADCRGLPCNSADPASPVYCDGCVRLVHERWKLDERDLWLEHDARVRAESSVKELELTPDELAARLAAIPIAMWEEATDNNDEPTAWRAIANALLTGRGGRIA